MQGWDQRHIQGKVSLGLHIIPDTTGNDVDMYNKTKVDTNGNTRCKS